MTECRKASTRPSKAVLPLQGPETRNCQGQIERQRMGRNMLAAEPGLMTTLPRRGSRGLNPCGHALWPLSEEKVTAPLSREWDVLFSWMDVGSVGWWRQKETSFQIVIRTVKISR